MLTRENAFLVFMSICLFQLPSSESCSPRCLCSVTVLMIVLFVIRLGIVTGGTRLVSLSILYIETGWEKLKDRTILFYKMSNNLTPQYLSNLIPQNFGMIHDHNTRHTSRIPYNKKAPFGVFFIGVL
jgi:hypothetical protein